MIRKFLFAVTTIGVLAAGGYAFYRGATRPRPVRRTELTAASSTNPVSGGAISPDGKLLAYADSKGIFVKQIGTGDVRVAADSPGWTVTAWFPDGARVLANDAWGMWSIPVNGAEPRRLLDHASGWSVSPDGASIAFTTTGEEKPGIFDMNSGQERFLDVPSGATRFQWSFDGKRIAFIARSQSGKITLESVDANGGTPALIISEAKLRDFCWLRDGRIVYWSEEPNGVDCEFSRVQIDPQSGRPAGKARFLGNWGGACIDNATATSDGKIAFRATSLRESVYVTRLDPAGMPEAPPERLTIAESQDVPMAWMPDSSGVIFQSNRTGHKEIFRQQLDGDAPTQLTDGAGEVYWPRITADGAWILFQVLPAVFPKGMSPVNYMETRPLLRVAAAGGAVQEVMAAPLILSHRCAARAPLCVVSEMSADRNQLVFTTLDPFRGRVRELLRFDASPKESYSWDLSSDGTRIAIHKTRDAQITILSLQGEPRREVVVKGWKSHQGMDWAADGKGLLIGDKAPGGASLLYADLEGNTRVVWTQSRWPRTSGVPSPDGRHLALLGWTEVSGMGLIEEK